MAVTQPVHWLEVCAQSFESGKEYFTGIEQRVSRDTRILVRDDGWTMTLPNYQGGQVKEPECKKLLGMMYIANYKTNEVQTVHVFESVTKLAIGVENPLTMTVSLADAPNVTLVSDTQTKSHEAKYDAILQGFVDKLCAAEASCKQISTFVTRENIEELEAQREIVLKCRKDIEVLSSATFTQETFKEQFVIVPNKPILVKGYRMLYVPEPRVIEEAACTHVAHRNMRKTYSSWKLQDMLTEINKQ